MRSANVHRCQDFVEKKRHNSLKLKVSHPSGVWKGLSQELGAVGVGVGGYPKSPYHMPRKILGKEIVHILIFFFLFFHMSY